MIDRRLQQVLPALGAAVLLVVITAVLRTALEAHVQMLPFLLAVLIAALIGGLIPGIVAVGTSAVLGSLLFLEPHMSLVPARQIDQIQLVLFVLIGTGISVLADAWHRARRRSQAEIDAAQQNNARFRRIFSHTVVGMMIVDAEHRIVQANAAVCEMLGYPAEELIGRHIIDDLTHPDDRETSNHLIARINRREIDHWGFEKRYLRKNGEPIWIENSLSIERDAEGRKLFGLAIIQNINDRKLGEEAIRYSERRYRSLIEATTAIAWATPASGEFETPQPQWSAFTGQSTDELLGWGWMDAVHPDDRDITRRTWLESKARGRACEVRHRLRRHDGVYRHMLVRAVPIRGADGEVLEWIGVDIDITERSLAESELHRRNQSLNLLADTATRLLREEQPDTLLKPLFDALAAHLGVDIYLNYLVAEDVKHLRLNASAGIDEPTADTIATLNVGEAICGAVAEAGERMAYQDVQTQSDPRLGFVQSLGITAYCCHPLVAHGRVVGTLSFGSRTRSAFSVLELEIVQAFCDQVASALERQRLNEELRRRATELAEASRAKDQFLAALSHELRTPLNPVLMAVSAMQRDESLSADMREDLEMIQRNVELEARLIDDLLDLTRIARNKLELQHETTDVHTLLDHAVEACCRSDINLKRITMRFERGAPRHHVWGDPARLQQVFWNLVKNAVKFTPEHGAIHVRTLNDRPDFVTIEVSDTGIGIESEHLPTIFDAFQQGSRDVTRRFGGLGLGLAIAKAIVDMHGGTITAYSAGRNAGARFRVELPLSPYRVPGQTGPATRPDGANGDGQPGRRLSILLVEDHESTAKVMERLLERLGYGVTIAHTVAAAKSQADRQHFDLVISDLGLPDGTGLDLMHDLGARHGLRGIALTGYGMEDDIQMSRRAGFLHHLVKPINLHQLELALSRFASGEDGHKPPGCDNPPPKPPPAPTAAL